MRTKYGERHVSNIAAAVIAVFSLFMLFTMAYAACEFVATGGARYFLWVVYGELLYMLVNSVILAVDDVIDGRRRAKGLPS